MKGLYKTYDLKVPLSSLLYCHGIAYAWGETHTVSYVLAGAVMKMITCTLPVSWHKDMTGWCVINFSNVFSECILSVPSPGQLQQRVQSIGNFSTATRQPVKATAYVSPTILGPTTMPSSVSLNSLSSIKLSKPSTSSSSGRSSLPRPASFIGTSGSPRSKIAQPARR